MSDKPEIMDVWDGNHQQATFAKVILEHSKETGEDPRKVLEEIGQGILIAGSLTRGKIELFFNSPNGL